MTQKKIGIDLDNTIINYENSFKKYLKDQNINFRKVDKNTVKNLIKKNLKIKNWTEAQEEIYGKYIVFAKPFKYFKNFEKFALKNKIKLFIVSHKTKFSQFSKKYNLHSQSNKWLKHNISKEIYEIYYVRTINQKIKKIAYLNPDYFIDDLIEIFNHKNFPKKIKKIHFSKIKISNFSTLSNWDKIKKFINQNETF